MAVRSFVNESELLRQIANGDQRAFKLIFDRYRPQIYTFSLKYLKSELQAEELVQEVFLKLWRLEDRLTTIKDLENYLLTLSRNKSFDMLRRMKLEARSMEPLGDWDRLTNDTEEEILLNDTRKVLNDGIALLPPQQKQVYQLCHQEGLKYEEVAAKLNLSPQTVHRHMKLALHFLRDYLSKHTDVAAILIILKLLP